MKYYEIVKELPNARAVISGEYKDLNIDDAVVVMDVEDNTYNAKVETRLGSGEVVVRVTGYR